MNFDADAQDRVYTRCAQAVAEAGREREALFLSRLALLLFERVGHEAVCLDAIEAALLALPTPSLSVDPSST